MHGTHLVSHIGHQDLRSDSTLHVVGVISNPARYHSRYRLYREWEKEMLGTPNVHVCTVEAAFGDRHHEVTEAGNPDHLQLRTGSEIWIKENMVNLGVRHLLPRDWKYVAWVDCDVFFRNRHWALEAIHQLQHFAVIQPWQQCTDLGPVGDILSTFQSFGLLQQKGIRQQKHSAEPYPYGHSGFAWAATRAFWEQTGGLMDFGILGSGDHHMAWGMAGEVESTIHGKMSPSFFRLCKEWQDRAKKVTPGQVGFSEGRIEHQFHGAKKNRYYRERWQILVDHGFDPEKDLVHDAQGLLQLSGKPGLEHAIRQYNRSRNEDGIDP